MTKTYDTSGRQKLGTDYAAISGFPANLAGIGALADPGAGSWLLEYVQSTNTWSYTAFGGFDASTITYTSTGSQWTATHVNTALHDLEAAVDVLQSGGATQSTGNFATGASGFTVTPTGTVYWSKVGSKVTLYLRTAITGTSNSAAFALNAAIPVGLRPAHDKNVPMAQMTDSGTLVPGAVTITSAGIVTFLRTYLSGGTTVQTDNQWTNSGVKAWNVGTQIDFDTD